MRYRPGYRESLSKAMQTKVLHKQEEIKRDQVLQAYDDVRTSAKEREARSKLPIMLGVVLALFILAVIGFLAMRLIYSIPTEKGGTACRLF